MAAKLRGLLVRSVPSVRFGQQALRTPATNVSFGQSFFSGVGMQTIVKSWFPTAQLAVLFAGMLWGQGDAILTGSVTDESKAIHPGATVTATETSTGRQYSATTDNNGVYRIVNIQPGTYRVEAQASGFATTAINNIELLVG